MTPSLVKLLDRLAECRPDVTALIAHLWELPTNEPADPLGWVGLSCSKPCGKTETLVTFCTNASVPIDDKRLSRDLSALGAEWLVDNLVTLAASKPWTGGVKRHHWPSWDYLFLDGWHDKPAELTFPARWKPAEVVVPPRLLVTCGNVVKVRPDGWLVEINNVLPRLADLVRAEVGEQTATIAPGPGRVWKDGPPPLDWHQQPIKGTLRQIRLMVGKDEETLHRYNGLRLWWIVKVSKAEFHLYARTQRQYAEWNAARLKLSDGRDSRS